MDWTRILAYITGTVDQELLLRNKYLVAENRILKAQIKIRLQLTDAERVTLAEIAHRLGRKALEDVANAAKPDTIMDLNAYAERWVKSVKEEVLSKLILFGEASLRRSLSAYLVHFHTERNHQGKDDVLLFPVSTTAGKRAEGSVICRERLGGLLKYYHREAA